jgi:hypothetical protein
MKIGLDLVLVRDDRELGVVDVVVTVATEHVAILKVHPQTVVGALRVIFDMLAPAGEENAR